MKTGQRHAPFKLAGTVARIMQRSTLFVAAFAFLAALLQAQTPAETPDSQVEFTPLAATGSGGSSGVPRDIDHGEQVLATVFYHRYIPFEVGQNVTADGLLTWNAAVNDFDLLLKKDGVIVASSSGLTTRPESFFETLTPGNYTVHVYLKSQAVVADYYRLTVDFEPAP